MKLGEALQKTRASAQHFGIRYTISFAAKRLLRIARDILNDRTPANPFRKRRMNRLLACSKRLHLGSGAGHVPGWINIDVFPWNGVDFVCNLRRLKKYVPPGSIESIFMSHTLEHFTKQDVRRLLADCRLWLKSGGSLWLSLPSLDLLYEILRDSAAVETMDKAVGILMGGGHDECDLHRCTFTTKYAKALLKEAGFRDFSSWSQPPPEFRGLAGGWTAAIDGQMISLNLVAKKRAIPAPNT